MPLNAVTGFMLIKADLMKQMPGMHVLLRTGEGPGLSDGFLDFTLLESHFHIDTISKTNNSFLAFSTHEGYPYQILFDDENIIAIEGIVYNRPDEEVFYELKKIADIFFKSGACEDEVKSFVESTDGDFLITIFRHDLKKILVFNDYLGRLTVYYHLRDEICIISKELKTILNYIPRITFNKPALAEYLMREYPFGNKTIFSGVFRLKPSQMITIEETDGGFHSSVGNTADFNFILDKPFQKKEESIAALKDLFLESMHNRILAVKKKGFGIIADLSGGFDTRTILAGLSRFENDADYYTFEYIRDESKYAQQIYEQFFSPGRYHHIAIHSTIHENELDDLIFKTDGLVNYSTTYVCYKDVLSLHNLVNRKSVRFSGLGGEFIRHPYRFSDFSLEKMCKKGFYSQIPMNLACDLVHLDRSEYLRDLTEYFNAYPEKSPEDQLKRFYYEYYSNYVGAAAEDRERIHFWTVQPLWSKNFSRTIFNRIPLSWVGFPYYVQFMDTLDPRLRSVPIFGSFVNLNSRLTISIYDRYYRFRELLQQIFRESLLFTFFRNLLSFKRDNKKRREEWIRFYTQYQDRLTVTANVLDKDLIEQNFFKYEGDSRRILTLLMYFYALERVHKEKLA